MGADVFSSPEEDEHRAEHQEHETPPEVHVEPKRFRVDVPVGERSVRDEHDADDDEERADRETDVQSHQKNTTLSTRVSASTSTLSVTGRLYHSRASSRGRSVS